MTNQRAGSTFEIKARPPQTGCRAGACNASCGGASRSGMTVVVDDDTGTLSLRFFKVYRGLAQTMSLGTQLQLFGEVKVSRYGKQIHHPEYQIITGSTALIDIGLQPIYPTVKGLHQNKLRTLIKLALQTVRSQGLPMTLFTREDFAVVADLPLAPFEPTKSSVVEEDIEDIFSTLARQIPDNSANHSISKSSPTLYNLSNTNSSATSA